MPTPNDVFMREREAPTTGLFGSIEPHRHYFLRVATVTVVDGARTTTTHAYKCVCGEEIN